MLLVLLALIQVLVLILFLLIWKYKKISYDSSAKTKFKIMPKKKIKLEQGIIIGLYVFVAIFIFYILASNYLPNLMKPINSGTYELNLNNPASALASFYFNKDIFGDVENERIIIDSGEIVNLVFKPKKIISESEKVIIEIEGKNLGTDVYLDEKLIIPDLSNYVKIKEFENNEIWAKKDLIKKEYIKGSTAETFVYYNFPSASVYSFKELSKDIPELNDWNNDETKIYTTFRDNLKLAVYHGGGNLEVEFTKQDLNNNVGRDEYTLTITDLEGKEFYNKVYGDDGDKKDSKVLGEDQDFDLSIGLERGIYYLEFKKDGNNKVSDSTLKDLKIGSNKVLIVGDMLVYEPNQKFFTKANSEKEIKFHYWWTNRYQKIYFTGDKIFTENINEDYKSKDYVVELEKGSYNFRIEKDHIWVKGDYFSLNEESWFNLPTLGEDKLMQDNDILIIDKAWLSIDGENIFAKVKTEVKGEESKYKFQVLDANKFYIKNLVLKV